MRNPANLSTKTGLMALEKYLLKNYFYNLPPISVAYGDKSEMCNALGFFCHKAGDDFDEEAMRDVPGYRSRYVTIPHTGSDITVGFRDLEDEPPYMDPLMHPELSIKLSPRIKGEPLKIVATLMHELSHYYCWYAGYDYSDEASEFLSFLRGRGLPTNYDDYVWVSEDGHWKDTYDYKRMEPYLTGFLASVS